MIMSKESLPNAFLTKPKSWADLQTYNYLNCDTFSNSLTTEFLTKKLDNKTEIDTLLGIFFKFMTFSTDLSSGIKLKEIYQHFIQNYNVFKVGVSF